MIERQFFFTLVLGVAVVPLLPSTGQTAQEFLTLNQQEGEALKKLHRRISPYLPEKLKNDLVYLIPWLRAKNFDVSRAEQMIRTSLKWREENKMDGILEEDWSDLSHDYPYTINGVDKEGRPLVYIPFGDWDIRKAVLSGKLKRLTRYFGKILEEATSKVKHFQRQGKNVLQFVFIADMKNVNPMQHVNVQCFPFYVNALTTYENNYPAMPERFILINSPAIFDTVINMVRPLMTQHTRKALQVYGKDQNAWKRALLKKIDPGQFPLPLEVTEEV